MGHEPAFRRRPAERRSEILDAAMRVFAERGFEKARIVDIARLAGVSHGTVGVYFPTKEALLRACIERMAGPQMDAAIDMIAAFEGGTADLLEALARFWLAHLDDAEIVPVIKVIEAEVGNFPDLADAFRAHVHDPVIDLFRRIIERGVARGEFACDDVEGHAQYCFGSLSHLFDWNEGMGRTLCREMDPDRYIRIWSRSAACGLAAS